MIPLRPLLLSMLLLAGPLAFPPAAGPALADDFVPGMEDLPVMPGLALLDGDAMVFDKPDGRIVEASAQGPSSPAAVLQFYDTTLPQLGWSRTGAGRYARAGEDLAIQTSGEGNRTLVRFTLSPARP